MVIIAISLRERPREGAAASNSAMRTHCGLPESFDPDDPHSIPRCPIGVAMGRAPYLDPHPLSPWQPHSFVSFSR